MVVGDSERRDHDSGMIMISVRDDGDHRFRNDRDQLFAIPGTVITMKLECFRGPCILPRRWPDSLRGGVARDQPRTRRTA